MLPSCRGQAGVRCEVPALPSPAGSRAPPLPAEKRGPAVTLRVSALGEPSPELAALLNRCGAGDRSSERLNPALQHESERLFFQLPLERGGQDAGCKCKHEITPGSSRVSDGAAAGSAEVPEGGTGRQAARLVSDVPVSLGFFPSCTWGHPGSV